MFSKFELKLAYGIAIALLVVSVIAYAARPPLRTEREPIRLLFEVAAGDVIFDHKTHTADTGYGISCGDCHHTLAEDEYADAQSCSECHDPDEGDEELPKRADAFHQHNNSCFRWPLPVATWLLPVFGTVHSRCFPYPCVLRYISHLLRNTTC